MEEENKKIGTLIKTFGGKRISANGDKYDVIVVWYRDENGKKQVIYYDRPKVPYYIIKDKTSIEAKYPPLYIDKNKVDRFESYSDCLFHDISLKLDCYGFYDSVLSRKGDNSYEMKNMFRHPWLYNADMDLQDRAIANFYKEFKPDKGYKLHKGYLDIEVDLAPNGLKPDKNGNVGYMGFPDEDEAPCPVNIVTLIDEKTMISYSYIVRNPLNTSLINFEKNVEKYVNLVKEKIKNEDRTDLSQIVVRFFNDECSAIEALFDQIHKCDFDFLSSWNQCYDVITLINRLIKLYNAKAELKEKGISGVAAMKRTVCDLKYASYMANNTNQMVNLNVKYNAQKEVQPGKRIDFFDVFDGINWVDSEYYYALSHAGGGKKDSYKLDDIAYEELGKQKLPFYPGQTIKNLPWIKFEQFFEYNVRDVLLLYLLERKNLEFNSLQSLSEITNTRKEKVYAKSISLTNFINKYAEMENFVMNCNKNKKYLSSFNNIQSVDLFAGYLEEAKLQEFSKKYIEAFEQRNRVGAYCSDPMQNERVGAKIVGDQRSMHLFKNVCDQDLSSLYPSIYMTINIDNGTLLGKYYLVDEMLKERLKTKFGYTGMFKLAEKETDDNDEETENDEDSDGPETNDLGPTVVDSLMSQDWESIGEKYFLLPNIETTYEKLEKIIAMKNNTREKNTL